MVPLAPLPEFAAHKEKLFPGMPEHPRIKHPQIGKLLPDVARHFGKQRAFPMDNFIVTQHQNEMLLKSVDERKGNISLMKSAVNGIELHVIEEVMHPAHVPFKAEPKSAEISRARNAGPGRRFLGDGHYSRKTFVANFFETFQKIDGIEIFAAAKSVRDPLSFLARIIEIQHRRDRIHPQTVDVILVEPEERIRDEKIADFIAPEIKNERAPIRLLALARVHVFVKIGAIEFGQTMRVFREMRRHPIHDHANTGLMTAVDKMAKLVRFSEATGGRIIVCYLINPGTFEGMLRHWHQFDVGITNLAELRQKRIGSFEVTKETISLLRFAPP